MNTPQQNIEKKNEWMNDIIKEINRDIFHDLTDRYFDIKDFERNGKIYEKVGIKIRKKVVLNTAWRLVSKDKSRYYLQSWRIEDIKDTISWLKYNESIHLIGMIRFVILEIYQHNIILWIFLLQNFYLVMLQRYNRWRLQVLLNKAKNRKW
jgi:Glycosyl-4,4'-diaponeurosporenoate acyltransferase